ncbi:MAG: DUF362 domain-containing protein [Promethearchaeota archaeon]
MSKSIVSIVKYEKPLESLRNAIELANGFEDIPENAKVFIKPNIVYWTRHCVYPKWGVLTTTRIIEDVIQLLKEKGINDITIGEGIVADDPKDKETPKDAFEKLGYNALKEKYEVKVYDIMDRLFEKVELTDDLVIKMNADMLNSDFLIDIPVLKTHAQCVVSLGMKNIKGLISIPSRKKFHSPDPEKNLDYNVAQLANKVPPTLVIIDGIYSLERGPSFDGRAHRTNALVVSRDILSADMIGANLLEIDPKSVPHLVQAAKQRNRPLDLSDVEIVGEKISDLASPHEWDYVYAGDNDMPLPYQKAGITGIKYHKYDKTMCTYCSGMNGTLLMAVKIGFKGEPFDNIEILHGKIMEPTPGMNKTILFGQCQCNKNKDHPAIKEAILIPGCPPQADKIQGALEQADIRVPSEYFKNLEKGPQMFLKRYKDNPDFDESFFQVK